MAALEGKMKMFSVNHAKMQMSFENDKERHIHGILLWKWK